MRRQKRGLIVAHYQDASGPKPYSFAVLMNFDRLQEINA